MSRQPRPDETARALAAYAAMFVALSSCVPDARIEREQGLLLVGPGAALSRYNAAFAFDAPSDASASIAAGAAFFAPLDARWMLKASGAAAAALDAPARAANMAHEQEPAMILTALTPTEPPPGLSIEPVTDVPAFWRFDQTMQAGFESEVPIATPDVMDSGALLRVEGLKFFLGRCEGVPVATATLFEHDGVACIADISVVPAYRRRGFGAAITAHAAARGLRDGCTLAYLEASAMGEPVYRLLGFVEATVAHGWLSPAPL